MEIAALGLRVDGVDNIGKASQSLDRFTKSSKSADQASGSLATESRNTSKSLADVAREGDKSSASMSKLAGAAKLAAGAFAGIKLTTLISDITMANSRFEQLGLVMGVVGRNAGLSQTQVAKYAKEVQGMGISMAESRQTVIRMTQAQMDLSKASELARLAQDAAVIANTNSSDALGRMIYGLQSGQVEILRTMGLNVNFAGSYSKLAAEMGVTADQLSEVDKVQARTNAVMEAGIGIAGAYDASMENAGKQLGSTTRYLQDLGVMWGEVFSDAARESIFGYSDALKGMHNTTKRMFEDGTLKKISEAIGTLTQGLIAVSAVIMGRVVSAGYAAAASFAAAQVQAVRYQATLAAMAGVSTSAAVGITAVSVAARAASGAMALLGGPVGVVTIAASAILYFATSASKAEREADELDARIQKLGGSFSSLNAAQAAAAILDYQEKLDSASLAVSAAENRVESLTNTIRSISDEGALERWERELVIAKGAVGDANDVVAELKEKIAQLTAIVDQNTASQNANNAAVAGIGSAAESYIKSIEERTAAIIDGNDPIKQANRHIKEHGQYSEEEAAAILKAAQANKAAMAAQKAATSATKSGSAAVKAHKSDIQELTARLFPAQAAQAKYNAELAILKKHLRGDQLARAVSKLTKEFTGGDADGAAKAIEEYNKNLKTLVDRLNPAAVAARTFKEEQELLLDAIARTGDPTGELARSLATLEQQYAETSRVTNEWTKWTESALERVDSAFADAWRNIGDGFEGFRKNLTNAFKQMLAELAHMAITRPIVMQIGAAIGIGGGGAVSGIGGMIGNAGSGGLGSIASLASSAYSALTGWGPAAMAGYQSGGISGALSGVGGYYGGMFSGGLGGFQAGVQGAYLAPGLAGPTTAGAGGMMGAGSMVGNIAAYAPWLGGLGGAFMGYQNAGLKGAAAGGAGGFLGAKGGAALGGSLGSIVPGLGTAIGSAVGAIAGGILGALGGSKLFGSGEHFKRTVGSATGYYGDDGYVSTGVDGSFHGGSRKFGDEHDAALDDINNVFVTTIGGLFEAFDVDSSISTELKTRLRRTSGRLATDFNIMIDGQIASHLRQYSKGGKIGEAMEQFADDIMGEYLAKTIVGSDLPEYFRQQFEPLAADSKVTAEQVAETLTGIFARFEGVNSVLEMTRHAAFELTDAGMQASDALIAMSGGLDVLAAGADVYYKNFFTVEEQFNDALDAMTKSLEDAGLGAISSREAYREMVEGLDLTTEAGQEMFATLMGMAGVASEYFSIFEGYEAALAGMRDALSAEPVLGYTAVLEALQAEFDAMAKELGAVGLATADNLGTLEAYRQQMAELAALDLFDGGQSMADALRQGLMGTWDGEAIGDYLASSISDGVYGAIAGGFANQITEILLQGIVAPMINAALTGASISEAVSSSTIRSMVAQAQAVAEVAGEVMKALNESGVLDELRDTLGGFNLPSVGYAPSALKAAAREAEQAAANARNAAMAQANSAYSTLERSIAAERKRITAEFNAAVQAERAAQQAASQAAASRAQAQAASLSASMDISKRLIDIFKQIDNAVKSALDRLMSTDVAVVAMRREQSLSIVRSALATARSGGSYEDIDGLTDAIAASSVIDSASYRTAVELQREQGRTANLISALGELNGKQLSIEEKLLEQLQKQHSAAQASASRVSSGFSGISSSLQAQYDADMAALDEELEAAKLQMDALNGVDNSIMDVQAAVDQMNAAVVAAIRQQNKFMMGDTSKTGLGSSASTSSDAGLEATIKRMYESTLGYEADAQGVKHWTDRIKSGESLSVLQNALTLAAASAAAPKIPAFASGGFHNGGLRIVGENGPELEATGSARIFNAAQTEQMLSGSRSNDSTSAAITRLENTIAQQAEALRAIAKHTRKSAQNTEILDRWDFDGMPQERTA